MAPLLVLLFVCFAAHGVSSASIHTPSDVNFTYTEDLYKYPTTDEIKNAVDFDTDSIFEAFKVPGENIAACYSHFSKDIKDVATQGKVVIEETSRLVAEVLNKIYQCGDDLNCKIGEILNGVSKFIRLYSDVKNFVVNFKIVAKKVLTCAQEGVPTPAPPTTPATTEPTTIPTTAEPTTIPTTAEPTTMMTFPETPRPTKPEPFEFGYSNDMSSPENSDTGDVRTILKLSDLGVDNTLFYTTTRPHLTTRRY